MNIRLFCGRFTRRYAVRPLLPTSRLSGPFMRLFSCQHCSQILFFENITCERCHHALGYWPETATLSALEPAPDSPGDTWVALGVPGKTFRQCANARFDVCNWLVDATSGETMCAACRHNRVIPELDNPENRLAWRRIESAKHRLFYTLFRFGLVQSIDMLGGAEPLAFQFMADYPNPKGEKVMTGHDDGVVTIALAEADDAERANRRKMMGEPYRTVLGHFRHEVGHYFWDRLVRDGGKLDECRAVFGNDEEDYEGALKRHYEQGAPPDWRERYISSYATMHAWEDFAETWAHYLHIVDTLEMAHALNLQLAPLVDKEGVLKVARTLDPFETEDIQPLIDIWVPASTALTMFNRTMGNDEFYPFVLPPPVIEKLGFMHRLIRQAAHRKAPPQRLAS